MESVDRRRLLLAAAEAGAATLSTPLLAFARTARSIRLIVGFPPGGAADTLARALSVPLRASLGATVVVENKPGAGGRIAMMQLRSAPADGSVLLVSPASIITLSPHLYRSAHFDIERDVAPVAPLARLDLAFYAGAAAPKGVATLSDLVAWLRTNPRRASCGVPGLGTTPHVVAALLGRQTGLRWETVPYQGDAPVFAALMGGEIDVAVSSLAGGMAHLRSGNLRVLAVAGGERSTFLPTVPTLSQAGYRDLVVDDRLSVFAPRQTPRGTVDALGQALRTALQSNEMAKALMQLSLQRADDTSQHFTKLLRAESDRWARTVKLLGLSLE